MRCVNQALASNTDFQKQLRWLILISQVSQNKGEPFSPDLIMQRIAQNGCVRKNDLSASQHRFSRKQPADQI